MGKLSGAEKKVVPVGSNWREARHLTNTCPMLLFRNKSVLVFPALRAKVAAQPSETLGTKRDGEKCRYGGIGRRTGFRIPRLVRESSSLSTCKYLYNFSRSISQKTLFLIFQLDLLSILLFRRNKRGSPRAPMSPIVPKEPLSSRRDERGSSAALRAQLEPIGKHQCFRRKHGAKSVGIYDGGLLHLVQGGLKSKK